MSGFMIFNDSTSILYLKYGAGASSTSFTTKVLAGGFYTDSAYVGAVNGCWASVNGSVKITELS